MYRTICAPECVLYVYVYVSTNRSHCYIFMYYASLSLPLSTELRKYDQVYEEAREADHTHANQMLKKSLDHDGNK